MKFASALVAGLAAVVSAAPLTESTLKTWKLAKRQNEAAMMAGLTDVDILQFALTLEWLEAEFYRQGFQMFPASDFQALGLTETQIDDLLSVGKSEEAHVTTLQSAIAQAGVQPVEPCEYNFGFTTAEAMVATAGVLEQVGTSAYLGAAPLISDSGILATAATITTMESRHQTLVRVLTGMEGAPGAFDTPLSPKSVFSLAAPFIASCPEGSNLALEPFDALALDSPTEVSAVSVDSMINFAQSDAGATHCAFTNGNVPGGTTFSEFSADEGCMVPQNLAGTTYVSLTNAAPLDGKLTDDMVVAGMVVVDL